MRNARFQFVRLLGALALAATVSLPALAQRGGHRGTGPYPGGGGPRGEARPNHAWRPEEDKEQRKAEREARRLQGLPPRWMERLQEMSPEQQERFLNNNEHFKNLPPERQAQIRRRLQWWNDLSPQQRLAIRERQRVWEQMTPEQQRHVREELLPKWQQLPPERRHAIMRRLHALHGLSDPERVARLNDPAFLEGLSPEDQNMLRELSHLRVGNAPEPPQENPQIH